MLKRIKSKLDMAEKTLSELKGIAIKTVQKNREKEKRTEYQWAMRHNIKQPKICIIGIPKEEERMEKKKLNMVPYFPNLMETINAQIQEAEWILSKTNRKIRQGTP